MYVFVGPFMFADIVITRKIKCTSSCTCSTWFLFNQMYTQKPGVFCISLCFNCGTFQVNEPEKSCYVVRLVHSSCMFLAHCNKKLQTIVCLLNF